jgi:hypothetical protein
MRAVPGLELIDARTKRSDPFGHSYFYYSPAVSSDIVLILKEDRAAGTEHGRPLIRLEDNFWALDDDYPTFELSLSSLDIRITPISNVRQTPG